MRRTQEQMQQVFLQWQQSGLSRKAFCRQQNIAYATFNYWYKRFTSESDSGFSEISVHSVPTTGCEVIFPSGTRMLFQGEPSVVWLRELLR